MTSSFPQCHKLLPANNTIKQRRIKDLTDENILLITLDLYVKLWNFQIKSFINKK